MSLKYSLGFIAGLVSFQGVSAAAETKADTKAGTSTAANDHGSVKQRWQELKKAAGRLGEGFSKNAAQATDEAKNDLATLEKKLDELGKDIDSAANTSGARVQKDVGGALDDMSKAIDSLRKKVEGPRRDGGGGR